jgi:hypothetical protein
VNNITITAITSIIPVVMLCIGIGIVMVPPIVFEALSSYSPDNETVIEEATNSTIMVSTLPTLSSALLILGLIGLGVHGLLKK